MRLSIICLLAAFAVVVSLAPASHADPAADILFIVDESGSMNTEHTWIGSMVTSLQSALVSAGVGAGADANRYGLLGYGGGGSHLPPNKHLMSGSDWGSAAQLAAATGSLVLTGGLEDGWRAINYGLNNYTFRPGAALNIVLITDEDRDNTTSDTFASTLNNLIKNGALLNVVVDYVFKTSVDVTALGEADGKIAYQADGSGGFTTTAGDTENLGFERQSYNSNNKAAYIDLAWATGGAGWDLDQLRTGGLTADSFTNAFVDVKVGEIQQQLPEPGALILIVLGVGGIVLRHRRRK